jgi:hypothetical protein
MTGIARLRDPRERPTHRHIACPPTAAGEPPSQTSVQLVQPSRSSEPAATGAGPPHGTGVKVHPIGGGNMPLRSACAGAGYLPPQRGNGPLQSGRCGRRAVRCGCGASSADTAVDAPTPCGGHFGGDQTPAGRCGGGVRPGRLRHCRRRSSQGGLRTLPARPDGRVDTSDITVRGVHTADPAPDTCAPLEWTPSATLDTWLDSRSDTCGHGCPPRPAWPPEVAATGRCHPAGDRYWGAASASRPGGPAR